MKSVFSFFAFTALIGGLAVPHAAADDAVSVRLKWIPQFQFAGYYVAKDKGFYADADLDVTINPGGPDLSARATVASGADEFGVGSSGDFYVAADRGLILTGLLAVFQRSASGYMVMADSGIEGPADFAGKTVAVDYGQLNEVQYRVMLEKAGVDQDGIREVKSQLNLAPFFQGRVDVWPIYISNEPFLAEQEGFDVDVIRPSNHGVAFYGDTLFAKASYVSDNPEITRRFVQATRQGWIYTRENPDEAQAIVAGYSDKDPDHLAFEAKQILSLIESEATREHGLGWQDPARYRYERDTLLEYDMIETKTPVDQVMSNEFLGS